MSNSVSVSGGHLVIFKAIFCILTIVATVWMFAAGSVIFAMRSFNTKVAVAASIANGAIYMSAFATMLVVTIAIVFPALLMIQPLRLWKVTRAEKGAVTPRQRFRGASYLISPY